MLSNPVNKKAEEEEQDEEEKKSKWKILFDSVLWRRKTIPMEDLL